jgi:hypothetical protein
MSTASTTASATMPTTSTTASATMPTTASTTASATASATASTTASWGIVGYREFTDRGRFDREMAQIVAARGRPARVVSGGAPGADTLARDWAVSQKIPFVEHPSARWDAAAFKARNTLIVRDSTQVVAFLSTKSRGTHDTMNKARRAGVPLVVIQID